MTRTGTVLAQTALVNGATGIINANGESTIESGVGGGGGGLIILASPGSVKNAGSVTAFGGAGGPAEVGLGTDAAAGGGGGGGGLVHFISPTVTNTGVTNIAGGAGGAAAGAGSVVSSRSWRGRQRRRRGQRRQRER